MLLSAMMLVNCQSRLQRTASNRNPPNLCRCIRPRRLVACMTWSMHLEQANSNDSTRHRVIPLLAGQLLPHVALSPSLHGHAGWSMLMPGPLIRYPGQMQLFSHPASSRTEAAQEQHRSSKSTSGAGSPEQDMLVLLPGTSTKPALPLAQCSNWLGAMICAAPLPREPHHTGSWQPVAASFISMNIATHGHNCCSSRSLAPSLGV
jgi:hypothetical protein